MRVDGIRITGTMEISRSETFGNGADGYYKVEVESFTGDDHFPDEHSFFITEVDEFDAYIDGIDVGRNFKSADEAFEAGKVALASR